jgi:hypothetical protein
MKLKVRRLIIFFILVLGLGLCGLVTLRFRRFIVVHEYLAVLQANIQEGDLICRQGDRIWSLYFKSLSLEDKRFSHMGIAHIREGEITVINAEGLRQEGKDRVNEVPLEDFIASARILGLYRLEGVDGGEITGEALKFLGRPFDWNFNLGDRDKLYCTELLYAVLQNIAPEIRLKTIHKFNRDIVPLEAVSDSPLFTEILLFR